jgi:hypothetical protein
MKVFLRFLHVISNIGIEILLLYNREIAVCQAFLVWTVFEDPKEMTAFLVWLVAKAIEGTEVYQERLVLQVWMVSLACLVMLVFLLDPDLKDSKETRSDV